MANPPSSPASPFRGFDSDWNPVTSPTQRGTVRRPRRTSSGRPGLPSVQEDEVFTQASSLAWDEEGEDPSFVTRDPRFSTSTFYGVSVASDRMADIDPIPGALANLEEVKMLTADDFEGVDPEELATDHLRLKLQEAERLKGIAQAAILVLQDSLTATFTDENKADSNAAKRTLILFIRNASKELKSRENLARAGAAVAGVNALSPEAVVNPRVEAARQFKADKVLKYGAEMISSMEVLTAEFEALATRAPGTDAEFRVANERLQNLNRRLASLKADGKSLVDDAVDAGKTEDAVRIDAALRKVLERQMEADSQIHDAKLTLGVINVTSSGSGRDSELKLPVFSGDTGDLDFYTFKQEFEDYVSTKTFTRSQVLRLLTRSCIEGPAKFACRDFKTVEEVFEYLKVNYGNPRLLLNRRLQDLRDLGACQGSNIKKRDWAVTVRSKLFQLRELSVTHSLQEELYFSPVIPELQKALPYRLLEDFKDELKKKDEAGNLPRKVVFDEFVSYMDLVVNTLTFEINFSLNSGESDVKNPPKAKESSKPPFQKPPQSNPSPKNPPFSQPPPKKSHPAVVQQAVSRPPNSRPSNSRPPKPRPPNSNPPNSRPPQSGGYVNVGPPQAVQCPSCPEKHSHVYYCYEFISNSGSERFKVAAKTRSCFKCLRMDSPVDFQDKDRWEQEHYPHCDTSWVCPQQDCIQKDAAKQRHITMCRRHVIENMQYEEDFVKSLDRKLIPPGTRFFTFFPQLFNLNPEPVVPPPNPHNLGVIPDMPNSAVFMMQHVIVNERKLLMFYDSGCLGAAINENAAEVLDTVCVRPGPTSMCVAGASTIEIETGDEQFTLMMSDRKNVATITALRMPEITTPFPVWEMKEVWDELKSTYLRDFPNNPPLPPAPRRIGGSPVDIMLGIRYLVHYPVLIFSLPCGLSVFNSKFSAPNGETAILGGTHRVWREAGDRANSLGARTFFTAEARAYFMEVSTLNHVFTQPCVLEDDEYEEDVRELELGELERNSDLCENKHCSKHSEDRGWVIPLGWSCFNLTTRPLGFDDAEGLGAEVQYRCIRCRNCNDCRKGEVLERISLKEEAEQFLIEESVEYNPEAKRLEAVLPFIKPPGKNLFNNFNRAKKILESQLKLVGKSEQMMVDVLASHNKLRDKGHVVALDDLPLEEKELVLDKVDDGYFIPWRTVVNQKSLSTPCRIVFDASSCTPGGDCLNNCLAKGENCLNNLLHVMIQFRVLPFAFSCDVSMAYNGIKLKPSHYRYQKYLWVEDLNPENPIKIMVVRTLIYGVRPSGNQLSAGFVKLAEYCASNYPEHKAGAHILTKNMYVDDGVSSAETEEEMIKNAESLQFVLGEAGLGVKAVTYSGLPPSEVVSADGVHVGLMGMVWDSEKDCVGIDVKPLFFGKIKRGMVPELVKGDIGEALAKVFTRRTLTGKVAGVFDPLGLLTPITAGWKMDLRRVSMLGLGWDDPVPEEMLETWVKNLEEIAAVKEVRFRRAVIPKNAKSLSVDLIISTDASENIAVACVHARVELHGGGYQVQLVAAKSKLVTKDTIPKAELKGAVMGACLSYVARSNMYPFLNTTLYVTDSTIVLYWIHQDQRPLQTGVRNGVVEIRRFSEPGRWFHIDTELNLADLGTRACEIEEIREDSAWQQGKSWMKLSEELMPIRSIEDVTMDGEQKRLAAQGLKAPDIHGVLISSLREKVAERYGFSQYLVDPNLYVWTKVTRIMGYILRFISKLRPTFSPLWKPPQSPILPLVDSEPVDPLLLSEYEINYAENYFFSIGTKEVKQYCPKKDYKDCTVEKNGILYYTSRILDGQCIEDPEKVMLDLEPLSFVKPVLDRYSPVSYSVMLYAHGVAARHRNSTCTLRESRSIAFIFRGRDLAVEVREGCVACRRFRVRVVDVEMGNVHENRLTIAPAFYLVQVDLFGPYQAVCEHNHRSVVKCYGVVFKDPSTSAVAIFMMQNYSTSAFLQAYTRFSSRYGHPAKMFIDAGSQLIKACKEAEFGIVDVARELSTKYQVGIEYQTCPVGGHNAHGAVERSIREIKTLLNRVYSGLKLDLISYETCFAWIANELNCFPLCLGSRTSNLDNLDLITPSRLLLGRNNRRSLGGYVKMEGPSRLMEQMEKVYRSWWKVWKDEKLVDYIPQSPLWKTTSGQPAVGDIVLFLKLESEASFGSPVWRLGRVEEVEYSLDGIIRTVVISYKNDGENNFRRTRRSARKIAVLHHEGDLELVEELNEASKLAGQQFFLRNPKM